MSAKKTKRQAEKKKALIKKPQVPQSWSVNKAVSEVLKSRHLF